MIQLKERSSGKAFYETQLIEDDTYKKTGITQLDKNSTPPSESICGYVTDFDDSVVYILFRDENDYEELVKIPRERFPEQDVRKNLNVIFSVHEEYGRIRYTFHISPEEFPEKESLEKHFQEAQEKFSGFEDSLD